MTCKLSLGAFFFIAIAAAPAAGAQGSSATPPKQSPAAATPAAPATPEDAKFIAIYTADEKWHRAQLGIPEGSEDERDSESGESRRGRATLPHVDAATQAKEMAHTESVLAEMDKVDAKALSPDQHLNYEVYHAQLLVDHNSETYREYEKPVNSDTQFWGYLSPHDARGFRRQEDYERYLTRMRSIPVLFDEETANMRAGEARGFTPPRVTLTGRDQGLKDVAEAKDAQSTSFWLPFVTMPANITTAEQARLRAEGRKVIAEVVMPAYAKLLRFFDDEYVPKANPSLAATSLPDGKAYYQSLILEYATVTQTPDEIHQIGLDEMKKIHAEMVDAMKASGFQGDFPAFLHFLRTDPQFYPKTPQELLNDAAWIAKEFDGAAPRFFGYEPRIRFAIVPVPPDIAPFYTAGRGGMTQYFLNTYDLPSRPLYALPALTLHESAPGHSWQQAIAQEQEHEKHRPEFRRQYISAYGEGWALYCERLGDEMGIYHTPYERFGMLSYQAWRAARLVVDTGVHAQGWTREQARQYLRENTALSDHEIETEVDRYISWPAQALSYYLGELEIQKERKKAEATLGAKFNIRAFHDAVLEAGSLPLPVFEEHMDAWIAGGGVGPFPEMER